MPQVGLDRAEQQRCVGGPPLAEHRAQGAGFDRVTEQRAGAVGLDVVDLARVDPGGGVRGAQHRHLGGGVGRHQTVGAAVLVDRGSADHREHPVAVPLGVGQPLEHRDTTALATDEPVGGSVEGVASAGGRHRLGLVQAAGAGRGQQQVHPGGQRDVRVAGAQTLTRQVQRNQRRRTRGVDRHRRAAEVEEVRHPVGDDADRPAGSVPGVHLAQIGGAQLGVVAGARSGEHPGAGLGERVGRDPGVFECLVGDLEQQPLLRVHPGGFARDDLEELGVERVDVAQEGTPPGHPGQRRRARRCAVVEMRPPLRGHLTDRGPVLGQEVPVGVGTLDVAFGVGAAGKPDPEPDDGDGLVQRGGPLPARVRGGRLDLPAGEELGQRVHGRVLPEIHRGHRASHEFRQHPGQDDRVARSDPEVVHRGAGVDLLRAAAVVRDEVVDQPPPNSSLVDG